MAVKTIKIANVGGVSATYQNLAKWCVTASPNRTLPGGSGSTLGGVGPGLTHQNITGEGA
jgi:hypothetical protein